MNTYTTSYAIRYSIPSISQQIEVAVVTAAAAIQNEDPTTTDHTNRLRWAGWVLSNSSASWQPFAWPVAQNATIAADVAANPSGQTVNDGDIQFVVNSYVESVVTYFVAHLPPGA